MVSIHIWCTPVEEVLPGGLTTAQWRLLRLVATPALDTLQRLDPVNLFKDPVPASVPGYAESIEHPMDFSTIRQRLQRAQYASVGNIAQDVRLLCDNAMMFNGKITVY